MQKNERLSKSQVHLLYSQSAITFLFPVLSSILLSYALWGVSAHKILVAWCATVIIFTFIRYLNLWLYHKKNSATTNTDLWLDLFTINVFMSGIIWGIAPIILIPNAINANDPTEFTLYNSLIMLTVCGLVAGAAVSYSISIRAILAYSTPALTFPALYLIALGDKFNGFLGGFVLLYFIFIISASLRFNKQFEHLILLEYRFNKLTSEHEHLKTKYAKITQHP